MRACIWETVLFAADALRPVPIGLSHASESECTSSEGSVARALVLRHDRACRSASYLSCIQKATIPILAIVGELWLGAVGALRPCPVFLGHTCLSCRTGRGSIASQYCGRPREAQLVFSLQQTNLCDASHGCVLCLHCCLGHGQRLVRPGGTGLHSHIARRSCCCQRRGQQGDASRESNPKWQWSHCFQSGPVGFRAAVGARA